MYKACLVAKGFHQQARVDFTKTFSTIAKPTTIRVVQSLVVRFNRQIPQLDINNAFLNGELQEEVYMMQLQGFIDPQHPNHVCRLYKSLHGLKHAPRA